MGRLSTTVLRRVSKLRTSHILNSVQVDPGYVWQQTVWCRAFRLMGPLRPMSTLVRE